MSRRNNRPESRMAELPLLLPLLNYGAFGVLVFIIWAVIFRLVPSLSQAFKSIVEAFERTLATTRAESRQALLDQQSRCDAARERQEERHERRAEKQDEQHGRVVKSIDRLCERIGRLEDKTDDHRPLPDDGPKK